MCVHDKCLRYSCSVAGAMRLESILFNDDILLARLGKSAVWYMAVVPSSR